MRKPGVLFAVFSAVLFLGSCSTGRHVASTESGSALRTWLELPSLLDAELGSSRVYVDATLGHKIMVDRVAPVGASPRDRMYMPRSPGSFVVSRPRGASDSEVRSALADEVLNVMLDRLYSKESKREALFRFVDDPLRDRPIGERIRAYGHAALLGETAKDAAAERWWKLRLRDDVKAARPRESSTILAVVKVYGYRDSKYVNFDGGHSAIAVLSLDQDPDDDILLNPGAKSREGREVEMPWGPKAGVLNEVLTANFWDWAETQTVKRHLGLRIKLLVVDPLQAEALRLFAREGNNLDFGSARMLGNNCANGARDILDSILPLNRELPGQLSPLALPREVLEGAGAAFPELAELEIPGSPMPEGEWKTPPIGIEDLTPAQRRTSTAFGVYRSWLDKYLH